jgi:hypothetical protein
MRTHFGAAALQVPLLGLRRELVVGSLLGDGCFLKTTAGYCFRVNHGLRQLDYVTWKYSLLREFVRSGPRITGRAVHFRTISHPEITQMRCYFYDAAGRKRIDATFLAKELTPFGFAVWFMDDGSAEGNQARLNVQSFSWHDAIILQSLLEDKFGVASTVGRDRTYPRLRVRAKSMDRLRTLVGKYMLPGLRYKLARLTE